MTKDETRKSLAHTLRHAFSDLLDFPVLSPTHTPAARGLDPSQKLSDYAAQVRFCQDCSLHIGRQNLVFGRGHWGARIAFIGDFPSAADDKKGEPFSDESGALLHKMIMAMKVKPEEAYLTNIYKCRPPASEKTGSTHFLACQKHLDFQLSLVKAPLIVALGDEASRTLARSESPLQVLRKQVFDWQDRKVICTHHPRELLQSPEKKKEAWEDLQQAMRELGAAR